MALLAEKWRTARSQVDSTSSLAELAAFEVEELANLRRPSVLQAIEERAIVVSAQAPDDDKLAAIEIVANVEGSKILAVIEGVPSREKGDGDKGVQLPMAASGGAPSMPSGRVVGPLVRVRMPDGSVRAVGLGTLRGG